MKYAQLLGQLMIGRIGVAVAGTHGKSTTTSMLAHVAIQTRLDPTFIVGATCDQIGGGARVGSHDLLLAEACEYDRSFHNFHPTHSIVLNVEADHLDVYGSLDAVVESFNHFARLTHPSGSLLIGHACAHRIAVVAGVACDVQTIGFSPEADWVIQTAPVSPTGRSDNRPAAQRVRLSRDGKQVCAFNLMIPGQHMAYNAAVAVVTAHRLGAQWDAIATAIEDFRGLDRRMQFVGTTDSGAIVIDDYGHHPTEIDATLRALRSHHLPDDSPSGGDRLICVFQPHQHSRTRFLLDQFASSFSDADIVVVPDIYFVRDSEDDRRAVSSADLVARLVDGKVDAHHIPRFQDIADFLKRTARTGDLIVVMGAGPVWQIARDIVT